MANHVATAETEIEATPDEVWKALTEPRVIEEYMFGTHVETDWQPGSRIVWKGEYDGKRYEDKGEILDVQPGKRLELTHYSPLSGDEDRPENYHTVVYELEERGTTTRVALSQDGNADDEAAEHSRSNWEKVLSGLKQTVESR